MATEKIQVAIEKSPSCQKTEIQVALLIFFCIQFCKVNRVLPHTVIRLPQERFGSHMIFILAVTSLLFSIIMSGTASAVDAVANSYVAQMRALVDSDDEDEQRQ